MNKYYWNFNENEEFWNKSCPTVEDCIGEARWEKEDEGRNDKYVYIGEVEAHIPFIDTEHLIDNIREQAYEECGEGCDGWLDSLKKEDEEKLEERLNQVFLQWLYETNNKPSFGKFSKVSKYNLETGKESRDE